MERSSSGVPPADLGAMRQRHETALQSAREKHWRDARLAQAQHEHELTQERRQAQAKKLRLVDGGRTLQQPIDARDVVTAILAACVMGPGRDLALDAGGPESLPHRTLVLRAARLYGNEPKISSLPMGLARAAVGLLDRFLSNPPVSRAMFDILQHDDRVDPDAFCEALGIELTPLDQTLADHVGPQSEPATSGTEEA